MATVLLVRHGRTTANATGLLAGRTPGVDLDEHGRSQAARTGERIAAVSVAAVVSRPLERCRQTAQAVVERQPGALPVGAARAFTRRAREVVDAGRPMCSDCGHPMDPDGHVCPLLESW